MAETIAIPSRFSGPPGVGNGGYSCGRFAALVGGAAEVTLRRPVPLERPLEVRREGSSVRILDGDQLVAEVAPADLVGLEAPPPVTLEQAVVGASHFPFTEHPFPTCFVCGPRRERLDGLSIHAYSVPDVHEVASPWVPSPEFADQDLAPERGEGRVRGGIPPEIIWASLDCPTGWAGIAEIPGAAAVLGRFAVRIDRPVVADRAHIVVARATGRDGRKLWATGGLYTAEGMLCAVSRATWILVDGRG
jgi:hypothetical protein